MSTDADDHATATGLTAKPNRATIVKFIGERGEVGFKELRSKLGVGVGTLYYHLDGLAGIVAQNDSRRYILTERGKKAYVLLKEVDIPKAKPRAGGGARDALGELLFLESYVERLGQEPASNLPFLLGVIVVGTVLATTERVHPIMFFLRGGFVTPATAAVEFVISWLAIFIATALLVWVVGRSSRNLLGVAASTSFALVPLTLLLLLDGLRIALKADFLSVLFVPQYFFFVEILFAVWAAYILTTSLRAAVELSFERALVVTLIVFLVDIGYLWLRSFTPL